MDYLRILFVFILSISDYSNSFENVIIVFAFILMISSLSRFILSTNTVNIKINRSINLIVLILLVTHFISLFSNISLGDIQIEPSLKFVMYFFVFYDIMSIKNIKSKKNFILLTILFFSIFHLSSVFLGEQLRNNYLYSDPNYLFFIYSIYIYLLVFCINFKNNFPTKILIYTLLLLLVYLMFTTQSRGGIISLVFALIYYIIKSKKSKSYKFFLVLFISFTTYLSIIYFEFSENVINRFSNQRLSDRGAQDSRLIELNSAIKLLINNPEYLIVGTGPNNFSRIQREFIQYNNNISRVHNSTIGVLFEFGFLALFAYLKLFFVLYKYFKDPIERTFLVYIFINSQSIYVINFVAFWILIAFLLIVNKSKK
tara:strand:- start:9621 stop:10730 length:1110 start_codon:yes stop_codon:yes gene_type:complete